MLTGLIKGNNLKSSNAINTYTSRSSGNLYQIQVQIQNAFGGWTPTTAISDSGNEISIFKREVLDELGLNPAQGQDFNVSGINGPGRKFKKFKLWVKIGTLKPVQITIGFAMNKGDLVENLLGNKDVVKSGKFEVKYSGDGVTYTQKAFFAGRVSMSSDGDPTGGIASMLTNPPLPPIEKDPSTSTKAEEEQAILNKLYEQLTTGVKAYEKPSPKKNKDDKKEKCSCGCGQDKKKESKSMYGYSWNEYYNDNYQGYGDFYC